MIKNGQRPVPATLTTPLNLLAEQLATISEQLAGRDMALRLFYSLANGRPSLPVAITKVPNGGLLQLGDALLLPPMSDVVRVPQEIALQTNGVLGNHLEVRYASGAFGFVSQEHHSLATLTDTDPVNWIEIEAYRLDTEATRQTRGFGFVSEEGISWLLEPGDSLHCRLVLTFPRGYYQYLYLATPPFLQGAIAERILAGSDLRYSEVPLGQSLVLPLDGEYDTVTLELRQDAAYRTTIGHAYAYEALTPTGEIENPYDMRRIPGPFPNLRDVGALVGSDRLVSWAPLTLQPKGTLQRPIAPVEVLAADRYAIGLSEASLLTGGFVESGEMVLGPFEWTDVPARLRLDAAIQIPADWSAGTWVEMDLSSNQTDWYPIAADGITAPRRYVVGQIPVQEGVPVIPAREGRFWLRVRLHRPLTDATRSPIVGKLRLVGEI